MEKREQESTYLPKARTQELVCQRLDDEVLIYDLKRHKAHCLNRTAYLIFQTCDGKKTVSDITQELTRELEESVSEEIVWVALHRLGKARLLEQSAIATTGTNLARREVLRKLGLATAIALPIVTSIVAPESVQAQSCLTANQDCSTMAGSIPCCSGLACTGTNPSGNQGMCTPLGPLNFERDSAQRPSSNSFRRDSAQRPSR